MMSSEEFIRDYISLNESLFRVAFYLLESRSEAEDAVQDLYLKLWSNRETLEAVHNPRAYCITLMKNMCIDRIRSTVSHKSEEIRDDTASVESADSQLIDKERLTKVLQVMESLSERQKMIVQMRIFENLSYEEIAYKTGINALVLRVTLSNARHIIKKAL